MTIPWWATLLGALGVPAMMWGLAQWAVTAKIKQVSRAEFYALQAPCKAGCAAGLTALEARVTALETLPRTVERLEAAVLSVESSSERLASVMEQIAQKVSMTAELLARVDERTAGAVAGTVYHGPERRRR